MTVGDEPRDPLAPGEDGPGGTDGSTRGGTPGGASDSTSASPPGAFADRSDAPGTRRDAAPPGFRRLAWPPEAVHAPIRHAAVRVGPPAPAGLAPRFGASVIDAMLVGIVWLVASMLFVEVLTALGSLDPSVLDPASLNGLTLTDAQFRLGLFTYAIFIALRGFYLVYAWSRMGATFGQQAVGIRVVDATSGRPPSLGRSLVRWLVNDLPGVSLLIGVGILVWYAALGVSIRRDPSRRGFHDEASRCLVVQQSREGAGGAVG